MKADVISALASQAPRPAWRIREMAWVTVEYWSEKSELGMRLFMLGMEEPWGEERSMIRRFFAGVFASGNTYRADTECGEGWGREGTYHKSLPDFLFNQGVYGVRVCQGGLEVVAIVRSGWECEKAGGKPIVKAVDKETDEVRVRMGC